LVRNFQSSQTDEEYQKHLARNRNRQGRNQDRFGKPNSQWGEEEDDGEEAEEEDDDNEEEEEEQH
jgi:hypothetical protein